MLDILRDYLTDAAAPEQVDAISAAHASFEQFGLENYEPEFEQILMLDSQVDGGQTVSSIIQLTQEIQTNILQQHGISLTDSVSISTANTVINGLLEIQTYEDVATLKQLLDSDGSSEELFAMALELVTDQSTDELLTILESVSAFLITKLKDLANRNDHLLDDDDSQDKAIYVAAFSKFYAFIKAKSLLTMNLLSAGVGPGFPFMVYANALMEQLDDLKPQNAAEELIAMALISSDGIDNPRAVIQANIDHLIPDIDKVTRIDKILSELLLGYNQYEEK
jgi:hypothetical protein